MYAYMKTHQTQRFPKLLLTSKPLKRAKIDTIPTHYTGLCCAYNNASETLTTERNSSLFQGDLVQKALY